MSDALADLLAKEAKLKADLIDPAITEIDKPSSFFAAQIGLRPVMCGPDGRLWDVGVKPMKVIFDPRWLSLYTPHPPFEKEIL